MSRRTELAVLFTFCTALFASCLLVYTQHNTFPYYSHHDERRKVKQLLTRDFNFNHPHLLLLSTDIVRRARGQTDNYQSITQSGRWVSATFAAASIVLLSLLGWRAFGLLGAWCVGLLVAVCPIAGVTAHFLKEDTTLLFGVSASLLALIIWLEKPSRKRLIYLGLACGLAVSAKYIGALFLVAATLLVLTPTYRSPGISRLRQLALLFGPAILVFAVINWPVFSQMDSFLTGVDKGAGLVAQGRPGKLSDLPNLRVIGGLITLSWPVLLMAFIGVLCLMSTFLRKCVTAWALLCTCALFTGILLLTPMGVPDRYLLLPAISLHALAGLAIVMLAELTSTRRGSKRQSWRDWNGVKPAAAIAAVVLAGVSFPVYKAMAIDGFDEADARAELILWVNSSLNDGTKLAAFRKIGLPGVDGREPADAANRFDRDPLTIRNTVEISPGTLQEMRSNGITHLVVKEQDWSHYLAVRGSTHLQPVIVWRTPERFKTKNRWLQGYLIVVQL